jgi:hypothetical protein
MEKPYIRWAVSVLFRFDSVGLVVIPRVGPVGVFPFLFELLRTPAEAVVAELVLDVAAFLAEFGVASRALEDLHDLQATDFADGHFRCTLNCRVKMYSFIIRF